MASDEQKKKEISQAQRADQLRRELSYGDAREDKKSRTGFYYSDPSTGLAINKGYFVQIYHFISDTSVYFKAFLTDFADNFSTNYNKEQVFGRTDPIQIFQGTERTINLAFDLVSSNIREAKANLDKSNRLISMMYPEYGAGGSSTQLKSGPLFKVKMGNLICRPGLNVVDGAVSDAKEDGLACTIAGFKYNPSIDDGFFDPKPGVFYPQTINIDLELTILHEQTDDDFIGWKGGKFQAKQDTDPGPSSYPHAADSSDGDSENPHLGIGWKEREAEKRLPYQQGISTAQELAKDLVNERLRVQANKILSPKDRQNLSNLLSGDFMDIDVF